MFVGDGLVDWLDWTGQPGRDGLTVLKLGVDLLLQTHEIIANGHNDNLLSLSSDGRPSSSLALTD